MTKDELFRSEIKVPDEDFYKAVKEGWDSLSKPLDGLGDFEEMICKIGAIQKTIKPEIGRRTAVVFCADNGVVCEGVSQSTQEVTALVARQLGLGKSTLNILADAAHTRVLPVDIGMAEGKTPAGVVNKRVANGTKDFLLAPAMTEEEALLAISHGIRLAKKLSEEGEELLAVGEMGIGNTTTAAAILSILLDKDSDELTGRGAGLDDASLEVKKRVIRQGTALYNTAEDLSKGEQAFRVLCSLGGLEICGMTGLYIGGAMYGIPVVIDGMISAAAALVAERMVPGAKEYMLPSHAGREQGTELALTALGLRAPIRGNMALGEATGAVMLFPLLDMAVALYAHGTRFTEAGIDAYRRDDV